MQKNKVLIGIFIFLLFILALVLVARNYREEPTPQVLYTSSTPTPVTQEGSCSCESTDDPVCGQNYSTYPNQCEAACDGVGVAYRGACKMMQFGTSPPANCPECTLQCQEGLEMPADARGCPVCECRLND